MKTSTGFLSSPLLVFNGFTEKRDDQQTSSLSIRLMTYHCSTSGSKQTAAAASSNMSIITNTKDTQLKSKVQWWSTRSNSRWGRLLVSDPISERLTDIRLTEHPTPCETISVCLVSDDGTKFPSHFLHLFACFEKLRFVAETEKRWTCWILKQQTARCVHTFQPLWSFLLLELFLFQAAVGSHQVLKSVRLQRCTDNKMTWSQSCDVKFTEHDVKRAFL